MTEQFLRELLSARDIHPSETELAHLARRWQAMARRAPGPEVIPGEAPPALQVIAGEERS